VTSQSAVQIQNRIWNTNILVSISTYFDYLFFMSHFWYLAYGGFSRAQILNRQRIQTLPVCWTNQFTSLIGSIYAGNVWKPESVTWRHVTWRLCHVTWRHRRDHHNLVSLLEYEIPPGGVSNAPLEGASFDGGWFYPEAYTATLFGGVGGGASPPWFWQILIFCFFAHTILFFSNLPPPPRKTVKILPPLEKQKLRPSPYISLGDNRVTFCARSYQSAYSLEDGSTYPGRNNRILRPLRLQRFIFIIQTSLLSSYMHKSAYNLVRGYAVKRDPAVLHLLSSLCRSLRCSLAPLRYW